MSFFAIRYPFFILMACMTVVVVGIAAITSMPVDLFPPVNIPVVVVATFYAGVCLPPADRIRYHGQRRALLLR